VSAERAVYRRALVGVAIALGVIAVAGIGAGWVVDGTGAAVAAAVGAAAAAIAGLATPASMLIGAERPVAAFGALVTGIWLGKMVFLVAVIAVVSRIEGFHREPFAWTMLAGVIASLAVDLWAVRSSRVPYVVPDSK
jgi:hypothetical protein